MNVRIGPASTTARSWPLNIKEARKHHLDAVFICRDGSIAAHKCILGAESQVGFFARQPCCLDSGIYHRYFKYIAGSSEYHIVLPNSNSNKEKRKNTYFHAQHVLSYNLKQIPWMDIYVAGEKELKMYGHKGYNYNPKTYLVHMRVHRNRNKKLKI